MAYTPTVWATGDVITAEKLNKMETGIGDALNTFVFTCTVTAQDFSGTIDKTPAEINAALEAGKKIYVAFPQPDTTSYVPIGGYTTYNDNISVFWYILYRDTNNNSYWVRGATSYDASTYSVAMFTLSTPST